ncbi:hypothetical protein TNCV_3001421 [Trichonephila clavipes]|nr:hypothetical protein TNCV_3001421 [Trichonephila clavipes]
MGGNENRMKNVSNQENSRQNGEEDVPETQSNSIDAGAGGEEERRKAVRTAERSKSKAVTYHPRTQNKMTQCSAANLCC